MQLVFVQESQPIDAILLIFAKICIDADGQCVGIQLGTIEQLFEEMSFFLFLFYQLLR